MARVDIILATYNGEEYLPRQIESVISQTHKDWRLLISDDGSKDRTLEVLAGFEEADRRVVIVNKERQGGVVENFSCGLGFVEAPYIMFCDQDDVWFPNRIENMLVEIRAKEKLLPSNTPVLLFSDLCLVNEDEALIDLSFYRCNKLDPRNNLSLRYLAWRSTVYGCSVMFNKPLLDASTPMPEFVPMHDHWFALNAVLYGKVCFYDEPTLKYRQHSLNVVGGKRKNLLQKAKKFRVLFQSIQKSAQKVSNQWNYIGCRISQSAECCELPWVLDSFSSKLKFLNFAVKPFWQEKKLYALIFCICFILPQLTQADLRGDREK